MEVTVNGTTVVPYLFFTSSTQLAGVPSLEASQFTADGLDLALFGCLDVTIVVSVTFE